MLERADVVPKGSLKKSSVHRLLAQAGVSARPRRGPACERRSFLAEHAGDLVVGDALHVAHPVLGPDGKLQKTYLLSQIDNATRYVVHSFFADSEDAPHQEYGFKQVLLKAHRTFREEVEDELPPGPIPMGASCKRSTGLGSEPSTHARKHDTTGRAPQEHFVAEAEQLRPASTRQGSRPGLPPSRDAHPVRRDGTVRWGGGFLEVRAELRGKIQLRYDPMDDSARPRVFVAGRFHSDTVPLDRLANMHRVRRRVAGDPDPHVVPTGLDPLALIRDEHYRRTRPVRGDDDDTTP